MTSSHDWAILLAGDLHVSSRLRRQVAQARIIAADAGIRHAAALGREPQVWIGDFDSAPSGTKERYRHIPRLDFPADKDATDGELAIAEARRRGARRIFLLGAFGGCAAHSLAHMTQLAALASDGLAVMASSGTEEAWGLSAGHHVLDIPQGARFSLIGFSDLEGLDLEGAKWPLRAATIPLGSTHGLSNVAIAPAVSIRLMSGTGVVILSLPERNDA